MKQQDDRRRRGRPRVAPGERSVPVLVTFSASSYRTLEASARAARITVPEAVRRRVDKKTEISNM